MIEERELIVAWTAGVEIAEDAKDEVRGGLSLLFDHYERAGLAELIKRVEVYDRHPACITTCLVYLTPLAQPSSEQLRAAHPPLIPEPTNSIYSAEIRFQQLSRLGWEFVHTDDLATPHPEGRARLLGPNPRLVATGFWESPQPLTAGRSFALN